MGSMAGSVGQAISNSQLGQSISGSPMGGMQVSNQMYQPRSPQYDPYTASRRPNYMPYGPNQQFYQPIYQPSYSQFSPMGYDQAPFGGFYQPPMMGFGQRFGRQMFQQPQQNMFEPATDISDQGQAALRQMPQQQDMFRPAADIFGPAGERTSVLSEGGFSGPMLSPQPMQTQYNPIPMQQASGGRSLGSGLRNAVRRTQNRSNPFSYSVNYDDPMLSPQPIQTQYRPIPIASQTSIDQVVSKAKAEGAAEAAANQAAMNTSYGASGGKVHGEGIDSLLKK